MKKDIYTLFHNLTEPYAIERVDLFSLAGQNSLSILKARRLQVTVEASFEQMENLKLENPLISFARQIEQQKIPPPIRVS